MVLVSILFDASSCFVLHWFCSRDTLAIFYNAVVARGDLGVECQPEDVPILQKTIIDECRRQGKPSVVATQMMESSKSL